MNRKQIVKLTNFLCIAGALLLIYWVFAFSLSTVFDFKVFQKNLSQLFGISVFGFFAVVGCALILNIALNLSRIADSIGEEVLPSEKSIFSKIIILLIPFPLIASFLYFGDVISSQRKEAKLIEAAEHIINTNSSSIDKLSSYSFDQNFISRAEEILKIMSKEDENFPQVTLIVPDIIDERQVFLSINPSNYRPRDVEAKKSDFIYTCSKEEREYLHSVFHKGNLEHLFSANDGKYEMYMPIQHSNKMIVLYFSEYAYYGKLGS